MGKTGTAKPWLTELLEKIESNDPSLTSIQLVRAGVDGGILKKIASSLRTNTVIKNVDFQDNKGREKAAEAIANLIETNQTLTEINLRANALTDEGVALLGKALANNKSITKLNLSENGIRTAGAEALAASMHQNSTLRHMILRDNEISGPGIFAIVQSLRYNRNLTILDCARNSLEENGAEALAEAFIAAFDWVEINKYKEANEIENNCVVMLDDSGIDEQGIQIIAEKAISSSRTPTILSLACNDVGDGGSYYLSQALKANTSLVTLDLTDTEIGDAGGIFLMEALKLNSTLKNLKLARNELGDPVIPECAIALCHNTSLTDIDLSENNFDLDKAAEILSAALHRNITLVHLKLHDDGPLHIEGPKLQMLRNSLELNKLFKFSELSFRNNRSTYHHLILKNKPPHALVTLVRCCYHPLLSLTGAGPLAYWKGNLHESWSLPCEMWVEVARWLCTPIHGRLLSIIEVERYLESIRGFLLAFENIQGSFHPSAAWKTMDDYCQVELVKLFLSFQPERLPCKSEFIDE